VILRIIVFLTPATLVLGGLHYYVWLRLFRAPGWPGPVARVAAIALVTLCLALPAGIALFRRAPRWLSAPFSAVLFVWLGYLFISFLLLLGFDVARAVLRAIEWFRTGGAPVDLARRRFIARIVAGAAATGSTAITVRGIIAARAEITTPELPVRLARLPKTLDGFTIAQLSDVHVGLTIGRRFLASLVEKTNAMKPDLIVITGDLVDGNVDELAPLLDPITALRAHYGCYFSPGNHDHYSGIVPWLNFLPKLGLKCLVNQRESIGDAGGSFDLVAIDDWHGVPDLARALVGRDPARESVLMSHQPRGIEAASQADVGLQLSGHTHGGQIFPFGALVRLQQPYVAGLHRHGTRTQIYVSRGSGYWGPPVRVLAPAEVTKIVLVSS
jgi:predicted MPP superfamily phosphohydrolase